MDVFYLENVNELNWFMICPTSGQFHAVRIA